MKMVDTYHWIPNIPNGQRSFASVSAKSVNIGVVGSHIQPASKDTIRRDIIGTKGFRYTVTQTLPQCNNEQSKRRRLRWAICFNIYTWTPLGLSLQHPSPPPPRAQHEQQRLLRLQLMPPLVG